MAHATSSAATIGDGERIARTSLIKHGFEPAAHDERAGDSERGSDQG